MKTPAAVGAKEAPARQEGGRSFARAIQVPQPVFAPPVIIQRKCACGGECPSCQEEKLEETHPIQTKLTVNAPGDAYEQEADRVADQVVATQDQNTYAIPSPVLAVSRRIQRRNTSETNSNDEKLSTPEMHLLNGVTSARVSLEQRISARLGYGSSMPTSALQFMESRFEANLSDVRIHNDSESHSLSDDLHAHAFTVGRDIFFAQGQYRPGTREGDRLVAHELAHVIQQSGESGAGKPTRVQRAPRIGNWAHKGIQLRLLEENPGLMSEVHIPGALSPDTDANLSLDDLEKRGFADFYRSDRNIVSGIRSMPVRSGDREAIGDPPRKYVNVGKGKILGKPTPIYSPTVQSRRPYAFNDIPGFPKTFEVGELKPLYVTQFPGSLGTGMLQADRYIQGFQAFAEQVRRDSNSTVRVVPTGSAMQFRWGSGPNNVRIPLELDLTKKKQQPANPDPNKALIKRDSKQRVWVAADPSEPGVLRYVLLPDRPLLPTYGKDLQKEQDALDPLLTELRKPHKKWPTKIPRKAKPGAPTNPTLFIQRKPSCTATTDLTGTWKDQWCVWEAKRSDWSGTAKAPGTASEFLKDEAEGRKQELDATTKLGINIEEIPDERTKLKRVALWAGASGRALGMLRFRFGAVFDRVAAVFEKISAKFKSFRDEAKASISGGGWEKAAIRVIGDSLVTFLKTMVSQAFQIASECVYGIVSKVIDYYVQEATEEVEKFLDPIRQKIESLKERLEQKYEPLISAVSKVLSVLDTIRDVVSMLTDIEYGLRLLIEAISCASPPALGCLWGLLAQVGFDLAAVKAIGTNLFREKIAEPAARKLLDSTGIGDRIRTFISSIVQGLGFGELVKDIQPCQAQPRLDGKRLGRDFSFRNSDPEVVKARQELEKENAPHAMYEDLEKYLIDSDGKPATREEIELLLAKIRASGLPPSEFIKLFKKGKSGKIDLDQAMVQIANPPPPDPSSQGQVQPPLAGKGGTRDTKPSTGADAPSPLAIPTSQAQIILEKADWNKVNPNDFRIDAHHNPPLILLKTAAGVRFGALIQVKETFKSAKPAYLIVDSGELILLNSTSDPYAMIATIESKKAKEKSFSFISGGHKGDVVAPVGAFIGLIIGK